MNEWVQYLWISYSLWGATLVLAIVTLIFVILCIFNPRKNYFAIVGIYLTLLGGSIYLLKLLAIFNPKIPAEAYPTTILDKHSLYIHAIGKPPHDCDSIVQFKVHSTNNQSTSYWMEVYTCPASIREMLSTMDYELKLITADALYQDNDSLLNSTWYNPTLLGSMLYEWYPIHTSDEQTFIYSNVDSTRIFLSHQ